jgi:hypothetical protein
MNKRKNDAKAADDAEAKKLADAGQEGSKNAEKAATADAAVAGGEGEQAVDAAAALASEADRDPADKADRGEGDSRPGEAAGAGAVEADDDQPADPRENQDVNVLAAAAAASMAYGTIEGDGTSLPRMDTGWLLPEGGPMLEAATCAAALLRKANDAPAETLRIHLKRAGFAVPERTAMGDLGFDVFAFVLTHRDRLDREAAEAARQEQRAPRGPQARPRSELAMVPPDNDPRSELGRHVSRRR